MLFQDAYTDFMLSREAKNVTKRTIEFYEFTLSKILDFFQKIGLEDVTEIQARHIRLLLKDLRDADLSDSYIHQHARVIKT